MRKLTGLRITGYTRLNNSVNGNPRFRLHLSDGYSYLTESDGSVNYDVQNFAHSRYENRTFTITLTNRGQITQMELEEEKFQRGQEVNGMTILEINAQGLFLAKWDDGADTYYIVAEAKNGGFHHLYESLDGYKATAHYVLLGGTIA